MRPVHLAQYLEASATRFAGRPAVVAPDGQELSYAELDWQAGALAGFLTSAGVRPGDRVGIALPKGCEAVVSIFGILKTGAAYVPVDIHGPAERGRGILEDCGVRAVICDGCRPEFLPALPLAAVVVAGPVVAGWPAGRIPFATALASGAKAPAYEGKAQDLAYILYTSGSTGRPKGVMLTHENATSFVEWCSSVFTPTEQDRFGAHAPFHFDLSVLDLFLCLKHGAALHLISDDLGKSPRDLARFIAQRRLTVWYSTPSALALLAQFGNLADHDASNLRLVLFAGEVFPLKHLRALKQLWPAPAYYNLYGPTETNVCTFARIPDAIADDREVPFPIGRPCSHCQALVLDGDGREVADGEEGLLHISGPSVFEGYWNRPRESGAAFVERYGARWYNTGDLVRWSPGEGYLYAGRNDRMVKRRGYRVELGEIERALYAHPQVREAAVVAFPDADTGVKIVAFLYCPEATRLSLIEWKTCCARLLPAYMIPDRFVLRDGLPQTSTGKTDYQALRLCAEERPRTTATACI